MRFSHLVTKGSGSSIHYHFRSKIPKGLVSYFGGRKQFQISLHDVTNRETFLVSQTLNNVVKEIYSDIRDGMKDLTLEDIKEILKIGDSLCGYILIIDSLKLSFRKVKLNKRADCYCREKK